MFSLIITIISIALVAALALATIYYGGNAFNRGSAEAKASQLINEGQQINGAVAMAKADVASGSLATAPATVKDLSPLYLAQVPGNWDSAGVTNTATGTVTTLATATISDDVCKAVNVKAGIGSSIPATVPTDKVYGCTVVATKNTVFYRF
jgi:type II secretory pathway pseudopilin PulG